MQPESLRDHLVVNCRREFEGYARDQGYSLYSDRRSRDAFSGPTQHAWSGWCAAWTHIRNCLASTDAQAQDAPDEAREAALWREHSPRWAAALNRRATVEQWMFDAANGKRPLPDASELRQWALKLGTSEDAALQDATGAQAGMAHATTREVNDALARYVAAGASAPPAEAHETPTPDAALRDPAASRWFRSSLEAALDRDPVDAANEAEVLYRVLDRRAQHVLLAARASLDLCAAGAGPSALCLPLAPRAGLPALQGPSTLATRRNGDHAREA